MRVLVTGATGFVGRAVVRALVEEGHLPLCLVRNRGAQRLFRGLPVEVVQGDTSDTSLLEALCSDVQAVVHGSALIREFPGVTFDMVNHRGTANLARSAGRAGVRHLVHLSNLDVSPHRRRPFFHSRWMAERAVLASGVAFTILRPSVMFGPGDRFVTSLARVARRWWVVPVPGDGRHRLQPLHVEDLARCVALCLGRDEYMGRVLPLGGPQVLTLDQVADEVMRALGVRRPRVHVPLPLVRLGTRLMERALRSPLFTSAELDLLLSDQVPRPNLISEFPFNPRPFRGNIDYVAVR